MRYIVLNVISKIRLTFLVLLISNTFVATLNAEVYKVIDSNGKVIYTDKPPQNIPEEQVEQLEAIKKDDANIIASPETVAGNDPEWIREQRKLREQQAEEAQLNQLEKKNEQIKQWKEDYIAAKVALKEAKQAQKEGVEIADGDYVGNAGGGARPSSSYLQRVAGLKADLLNAKKELKRLKRNKPKR